MTSVGISDTITDIMLNGPAVADPNRGAVALEGSAPGSHALRNPLRPLWEGMAEMTDPRITTLAEALFVVRLTAPQGYDRHAEWERQGPSITEVFTDEAAAILAALPSDWCGHSQRNTIRALAEQGEFIIQQEVEIARLRKIEDAARAALPAVAYGAPVQATSGLGNPEPALRAALAEEP